MSPYWVQILEQFIPATTLWTGGNLVSNGMFGRSKYQYKYGCQPKEFVEELYPDFENAIEEDLETLLAGGEDNGVYSNLRGLINLTGITYYPIIEIDSPSNTYGGPDYTGLTTGMTVVISGSTSGVNSAKLFSGFTITSLTGNTNITSNLPLICDYKDHVTPDTGSIKTLWKNALINIIDKVNNNLGYYPGFDKSVIVTETGSLYEEIEYTGTTLYNPYTSSFNTYNSTSLVSGYTGSTFSKKKIEYEFFTDVD
jgi:hypothetical protein